MKTITTIEHDTILAEIELLGFYTIPLGFLYSAHSNDITDLEKQVRISPFANGYQVTRGILRIDNDSPENVSVWIPIDTTHTTSLSIALEGAEEYALSFSRIKSI